MFDLIVVFGIVRAVPVLDVVRDLDAVLVIGMACCIECVWGCPLGCS